jgi:hypothetical protein
LSKHLIRSSSSDYEWYSSIHGDLPGCGLPHIEASSTGPAVGTQAGAVDSLEDFGIGPNPYVVHPKFPDYPLDIAPRIIIQKAVFTCVGQDTGSVMTDESVDCVRTVFSAAETDEAIMRAVVTKLLQPIRKKLSTLAYLA